jgi:hydroxymethylpyrimidine pyrophosphatase-like HAD family hydrolase
MEINFKYPTVHHNGTFVQNPQTGEYFRRCIFDKDIVSKVVRRFEDNGLYPMIYSFVDGRERVSWISGRETDGIKFNLASRKNDIRLRPVKNYNEFLDGDIADIAFYGDSPDELQEILNIADLNAHFTYHIQQDTYKDEKGVPKYWLEIMRFDATKDYGVKKVRELVGADRIICFGDNINDVPMFNVRDEKYAVANAIDEIKDIATAVIGSNEDDGVAKWLEKHAHNYI